MTEFQKQILESKDFLIRYLKHPTQEIRNLPDWTWEHTLLFQAGITAATGFLGGVVSHNGFFSTFATLFLTPILSLILISISCLFFYYTFQIFAEKTVSLRALYQTVLFANIPLFIFQIGASYFAILTMFGLAFSALLLVMAFVEKFSIPKQMVIRLILGLYVAFFLIWLWGRYDGSRIDKSFKSDAVEAPAVKLQGK